MLVRNFEFEGEITHKDWPIQVTVEASFYKGTTPGMGDDPDEMKIDSVTDGTGANILAKLENAQRIVILEKAFEYI